MTTPLMSPLSVGAPQFAFGAMSEPTDPPPNTRAETARLRASGLPVVLIITHSYGGGTERHVRDICERFAGRGIFLVLRTAADGRLLLTWPGSAGTLGIAFPHGIDTDTLAAALRPFGVASVHIHQLFSLPLDAAALVAALAVPFDFTVHDYHTICPRVHLKTRDKRYCGEPDVGGCAACLADHPVAEERDIEPYRARHAWLYRSAARVICPSRDVANRLARYHSVARLVVAPHDGLRAVPRPAVMPRPLAVDEPLHVVILGAVSRYKGAGTVLAAAALAQRERAPVRFSVIGTIEAGAAALPPALAVTGAYDVADLPDLLALLAPHLAWFSVLVPETYSYTLSEAFAAGLPVVVPDLGALAGRILGRPWSWVVPWDATPEALLAKFVAIRRVFLEDAAAANPGAAAEPDASDFYDRAYLPAPTAPVRA
jgi:glycosyltransferase involved in cell wall biosynthesis